MDDVLEVSTDNAAEVLRAGEGDVEGVGGPIRRDDAGLQVAVAQADGFDGDVDKFSHEGMLSAPRDGSIPDYRSL